MARLSNPLSAIASIALVAAVIAYFREPGPVLVVVSESRQSRPSTEKQPAQGGSSE